MSLMPEPAVPVPEWQHKAFTILTQCRQGMALFREATLLIIKKQTKKGLYLFNSVFDWNTNEFWLNTFIFIREFRKTQDLWV